MIERRGDLFEVFAADPSAHLVVTTNGALDRSGALVMGAGVAGAARDRFPGLAAELGRRVALEGNVPVLVRDLRVLTWPTKPASHALPDGSRHAGWMCAARVRHPSCLDGVGRLTAASGLALLALVATEGIAGPVLLPRPGCGLGGLDWAKVRPWMADRFDDRFVVVERR